MSYVICHMHGVHTFLQQSDLTATLFKVEIDSPLLTLLVLVRLCDLAPQLGDVRFDV